MPNYAPSELSRYRSHVDFVFEYNFFEVRHASSEIVFVLR